MLIFFQLKLTLKSKKVGYININDILYCTIQKDGLIVTHILQHYIRGIITSLAKKVMFLVASVSLSVCGQHYSKSYERIGMKFYGGVQSTTRKN